MHGVKQMSIDVDGFDSDDLDHSPPSSANEFDASDLPNVLIIANVDDSVFDSSQAKMHFEAVFRNFDPDAEIQYLKNFRRARVTFSTSLLAAQAKIQLHEAEICGKRIKVYFAVNLTTEKSSSPHLQPPKPDKQFLISPPASPPVGWESVPEAQPIINYDLLSAIASLKPGEAHELHPPSASQPGIVVHICKDPEGFKERPLIQQTKCPERPS